MRPLSRNFRRTVFWMLFALFVLSAPVLIGYSVGYRLDDALSLVQTGGIFVHSDMSNTSVFLDGVFVEENGAILRNTLIQDLKPNRNYEVWVEKDGYQSWIKTLYVRPNLVTEARILMLPATFAWEQITASTTLLVGDMATSSATTSTSTMVANPEYALMDEYFSADKEQFAIETATTTYEYVRGVRTATSTTVTLIVFPEWLQDVASSSQLQDKDMVRERDGVVAWNEDGNVHALWARADDPLPYYFCSATCTRQFVIDWEEPIERYEFYPARSDIVIIQTSRGVFAVELDDRSQRNIQPITNYPVVDFRILGDDTLVTLREDMFERTTW